MKGMKDMYEDHDSNRHEATHNSQPRTSEPNTKKIDTNVLAEGILETENFAVDASGRLFIYKNGVYQPKGEDAVKRLVKQYLAGCRNLKSWSSHKAQEVIKYISVDASELWEMPPQDEINVRNGLLNMTDGTHKAHSPDWLSPIQIPVNYDPEATCPEIDLFINAVFPEDNPCLAYEIFADIVTPIRSIQKSILLFGEGGNGKSTFLTLLCHFVGDSNCAGISLQKLEADKFASARLYGKLANVCPDLPNTQLVGTSVFKTITGGDTLVGEFKFKNSFEFVPFARLIFSTNHFPKSSDTSIAFWDRWIVVNFPKRFRGTDKEIPKEELDAQLSDPRQLSGLLNKVLPIWPNLQNQGFTISLSMTQAYQEFQEETDPIARFLNENTEDDPAAMLPKIDLVKAYNSQLYQAGQPEISNVEFGKNLKRLRPDLTDAQRTVEGNRVHVWLGIKLKPSS